MILKPKFVPWRPSLTLTGTSEYTVNTATGQITSHVDTWDALSDNSYLSVGCSLLHVLPCPMQQSPNASPKEHAFEPTAMHAAGCAGLTT